MPAGQGRLTGQEMAMRRLALALAAGGVLAAWPATALAAAPLTGSFAGEDQFTVPRRQETIMFTRQSHWETHRAAAPAPVRRLRRLAAAATAVIASLLAAAAVIPAASAAVLHPLPPDFDGITRMAPAPATTVRVVSTGGMAGWQITLIAAGAALAAAGAAVLLDRARAVRRAASAPAS
jgi:hypothetical protein